jgi:hypothetical protein
MSSSQPHPSYCRKCMSLYRSAVALSNMGVTLLERQCYAEAVVTLKDAVNLIRAVVVPTVNNGGNNGSTKFNVQWMIHRATNFLIYTSSQSKMDVVSTSIASTPRDSCVSTGKFQVKILSDTQSSKSDILQALHEYYAILVRLEDVTNPVEECISTYMVHTKASAILSNYGMACRCLHFVSVENLGNSIHKLDVLLEAMHYLKMSYRILTHLVEPVVRCGNRSRHLLLHAEMDVSWTLNLSVLVLQTLVNMSHQLDRHEDIFLYTTDFVSISQTILQLRFTERWNYTETAAMA